MNIHIILDMLPFTIGILIILIGPKFIHKQRYVALAAYFATGIFLLAQSSWFTALMNDNPWGRDWANYVWFLFNTLTLLIFAWQIFSKRQ